MSVDPSPVCRELDDLSLRMFELMEEQLQNNFKMQTSMKHGFIDIAKARYIMGNRSLSQLQLPTETSPEFNALSTVTLTNDSDCGSKFVLNTVSKSKPAEAQSSNEESLRLRKNAVDKDVDAGGTKVEQVKIVDPIKWFGVLVPQNLRRAQTGFTLAVELATESANLQLELESTQKKYKELRESSVCCKNTSALST